MKCFFPSEPRYFWPFCLFACCRAAIKFWVICCLHRHTCNFQMCCYVGELYQQQTNSTVSSRAHQANSTVTDVTVYGPVWKLWCWVVSNCGEGNLPSGWSMGTSNKLADKRLWQVCRVPITLADLIIKDRKQTKKKPYVPQGPAKVDNDDDDTLSKSQCHLHIHIFLSQQLIPCTL